MRTSLLFSVAIFGLSTTAAGQHDVLRRVSGGPSVVNLGDVDGDFVPDYVKGGLRTAVYSGASGVVILRLGRKPVTFGTLESSYPVANAGDFDGDGANDVLLRDGDLKVWSSGTGRLLRTFADPGLYTWAASFDGIGDVNGDGVPDVVVGTPEISCTGSSHVITCGSSGTPGRVDVLSGLDGATLYTHIGPAGTWAFGGHVARGGDVDGDGVGDYLVGTNVPDFVKRDDDIARAYSGATGQLLVDYAAPSSGGVTSGVTLAPLGDVDGDGRDDFLVGNSFDGVDAVSGRTGTRLWRRRLASGWEERYGSALAPLSDWNGDGVPDALVAAARTEAPSLFINVAGPGYVDVLSGRDGSVLTTVVASGYKSPWLGFPDWGLADLGDLDADGRPDFAVGGLKVGEVSVYSGAPEVSAPTNYCATQFFVPGGFSTPLDWSGTTSVSANDLTLINTNADPGWTAYFMAGRTVTARPVPLGSIYQRSQGFVCLAGPGVRLTPAGTVDALGTYAYKLDVQAWTGLFAPGSTWSFQLVTLDPTEQSEPRFSDALRVTFTP